VAGSTWGRQVTREDEAVSDTFAFVDTSIFLHYRPFDEIDWLRVLDRKSLSLVLAPITISELNNKKDEPTPRLRQRAALVIKRLDALWSQRRTGEVRPGVAVLLQDVEPSIDYATYQLDYRSQDDRLLAAVIHFRAQNPGAQVLLVTADFGLKLKAKRHGIETLCLPDDLKLPDEPDPNEKKIQELQREVAELKRLRPDLELTFRNGTNRMEVQLEPPFMMTKEEMAKERDLIRQKHQKLGEEPEKEGAGALPSHVALVLSSFRQIPKELVDRYNKDLDRFYAEYDAGFAKNARGVNQERLTVPVELVLSNGGTAPAEDIDVFLHFPDGFELYSRRDLPGPRSPPRPPEKPTPGMPPGLYGMQSVLQGLGASTMLPDISALAPGPRNVSGPSIRRTNSFEVKFHVEQLKHGLMVDLSPLYAVFDGHELAGSLGIDYDLIVGNMAKPTAGKLHVIVGIKGFPS
jgi:hypothetical protein